MSLYLKPKGSKVAIAICGRCKMKRYHDDLVSDPNIPGLMVCEDCADVRDPYRRPPRKPEDINLRTPRPEEPIDPPGD
jgi:hypothetical protein